MLEVPTDPLGARLYAAAQRAARYEHLSADHLHVAWLLAFGDPAAPKYEPSSLCVDDARQVHQCVHATTAHPAACCVQLWQAHMRDDRFNGPLACIEPELLALTVLTELSEHVNDLRLANCSSGTPQYTRAVRLEQAVLAVRTHILSAATTGFTETLDPRSRFGQFIDALDSCVDLSDVQLRVVSRLGVDFTGTRDELLTSAGVIAA